MSTKKEAPKIFPGPSGGGPARHFGGPKVRARNTKTTIVRLAGYFRPHTPAMLGVFLLALLSTLLNLAGPFLLGKAIDEYILPGNVEQLWRILTLMLVIYIAVAVTTWLEHWIMIGLSQQVVRNLRRQLFVSLQRQSLRFFDSRQHGDLMSRLTNDVENVSAALGSAVIQFFASTLSIVGVATMMVVLNWRLALVSLVAIPLSTLVVKNIAVYTRRGFQVLQKQLGQLNGLIEETISGQRVVTLYGQEDAAIERFHELNQGLRRSAVRAHISAGVMGPMMNLTRNISYAIIAGCGGWFAVMGWASVGTIASFLNYSRQFSRPINQLAQLYNMIQSAIAGAERIFDTMDEDSGIVDASDAPALTKIDGEVSFEEVCFGYTEEQPVLKKISFRAQAGQSIAIVGPTGAGKTTIINLLTRFYDIDSGSIRIDGQNIRSVRLESLRQQLGVVLQDTVMFSDTIRENIRYGRLDASDADVEEAARLANAEQFIHRMPQGYDTELSQSGSKLSEGQRQLIAIARAILADPAILILDEATSSVDTRTEQHIQEAMLQLMQGRTSFVIAHRLATIRKADCILVIQNGELVERGTHEELLNKRGHYHQLYTGQFST